MRFRFSLTIAAAASLAAAAPADAEWMRASSRHFVVYADMKPAELRAMTERLERFDSVIRRLFKFDEAPESGANPLTIYVADDQAAVERLCRCAGIAGFYVPRAAGAVAFTPRRSNSTGINALKPEVVLFHEYAHHLMLSNATLAYPAWFTEGYAEFVSTARFEPTFIQVGVAAQHRADGLLARYGLPIRTMLAPRARMTGMEMDQLYGRGWLMTHYIMFDAERGRKMTKYLTAINAGTPSIQAATEAFGDLKALDRALDGYLKGKSIPGLRVPTAQLPDPAVTVRPLTAGERALIDMRMVSTRGIDRKAAIPLHARAQRAAAAHPNDAVTQGWLAEMAYDVGDDAAAEAAADRALAADPRSSQALLYKGRVRLRRATEAKDADAKTWAEARSWIVRANRVQPDDAEALQLLYDSFGMARAAPGKSAVAGIRRALELAPQDPSLRFAVARQDILDGKTEDAKRVLRPLAYDPHASPDNPAVRLIALIDSGATGEAALAALAAKDDEKAKSDEEAKN